MKTIYTLELHETLTVNGGCPSAIIITRVASGWIYEIKDNDGNFNALFVPFDNEFQNV